MYAVSQPSLSLMYLMHMSNNIADTDSEPYVRPCVQEFMLCICMLTANSPASLQHALTALADKLWLLCCSVHS